MSLFPSIQSDKHTNSHHLTNNPNKYFNSSKRTVSFPKINTHLFVNDKIFLDSNSNLNEETDEKDFKEKKSTIKTFSKKNDLKIFNLNTQGQRKTMNLLRKNASLEFINLSKKLFENTFEGKKEKGSLMVNELWSNNYHKKVMKFSNLKNIMDNILKSRRSKFRENKKKFLSAQTLEFNRELKELEPANPYLTRRDKNPNIRRGAVTTTFFLIIILNLYNLVIPMS